jgi:hypothetical protein
MLAKELCFIYPSVSARLIGQEREKQEIPSNIFVLAACPDRIPDNSGAFLAAGEAWGAGVTGEGGVRGSKVVTKSPPYILRTKMTSDIRRECNSSAHKRKKERETVWKTRSQVILNTRGAPN